MPSTLWNASARDELISRVRSLRPDAIPRWGRMTAPQMLAHLHGWMLMAKGDLAIAPRNLILRFTPIKQLLIYVLPFPKGVPTAKELIERPPEEWSSEREAVCHHLASFESYHPDARWPEHPAFGMLTPEAWGVLGYRHTDHHLRQFGA